MGSRSLKPETLMVTRRTFLYKSAMALIGLPLLACPDLEPSSPPLGDCSEPFRAVAAAVVSEKLSGQEIETARRQVAEAAEEVIVFIPQRAWRAYQLIQDVVDNRILEESDRKLAAKAHRVMASVYFAAHTCAAPPRNQVEVAVHKLGQNGWIKTAQELEKSLRLDPKQPDASKLKKAIKKLRGERIAVTEFGELIDFLIMSIKENPSKR